MIIASMQDTLRFGNYYIFKITILILTSKKGI